jgi:regulator of protease activity HflC (stomatin/prohibitin superfamily)
MVVKTIVTPAAAAPNYTVAPVVCYTGNGTKSLFLLVRTLTGPLLSLFGSTVAVHGPISPTPRGIDEVVGRYEQSNGRSVNGAENFSWSGMSSAVRRLTQGALAPNPHTPVIKCTSGHHDQITCFPSTHATAGAPDPDDGLRGGLPHARKRLHPRLRAHPRFLDIHEGHAMKALIILVVVLLVVALIALSLSIRVVTQYEKGVLFRLGKVVGVKDPGLAVIIPVIDRLMKVSLRIVTMPIQSQGIITRDNVSVDISAVAYFRVVDAVKSVIAIENVHAAINQIAQTTLRKVVGQHTLDQALSETDTINADIRKILDIATLEWGVEVTLVELKDIQLPDSMKRAMARQAEAEREKRAKIIAAEGESMAAAALGEASDTMMAHPLALQLRNLQTLVELGVEKNTTIVFPAPLMSAIGELGAFLARESAAAPSLQPGATANGGDTSTQTGQLPVNGLVPEST